MFKIIKGVNENVKELVRSMEAEGIEVNNEQIKIWINDILDSLDKEDIVKVATYLLQEEHTRENLLQVYSFVNECFDNKFVNC